MPYTPVPSLLKPKSCLNVELPGITSQKIGTCLGDGEIQLVFGSGRSCCPMIISQLLDGSGEVFHVSSQFQKGPRAHRRILLVFEPCPKPSALEIPNQSVTFSFLNSIQVGLLSSDFDQCDLFQKQMAYFRKQTVAPSLSPLVAFGV